MRDVVQHFAQMHTSVLLSASSKCSRESNILSWGGVCAQVYMDVHMSAYRYVLSNVLRECIFVCSVKRVFVDERTVFH